MVFGRDFLFFWLVLYSESDLLLVFSVFRFSSKSKYIDIGFMDGLVPSV